VDLVSGPGCPVCVTSAGYVDTAIALAERGVILATFGDMIHVPGTQGSLVECRERGGRIEVCYAPSMTLDIARRHPADSVVFLAIGFETTIGPVVTLVDRGMAEGIGNLSLLTAFKLVPPALRVLLDDPELGIDAFLCPAHVSAIIGANAYIPFAGPDGVPCVIAGFEPLDILLGIERILRQIVEGRSEVENTYDRVVRPDGNPKARAYIARYLEPSTAVWRGVGAIPLSGLELRKDYRTFDACAVHGVKVEAKPEPPGCLCGDVIKGKLRPSECPLFGRRCTPDTPVGPCMVSSEGSCAASFKYARLDL
jgi:hydrogenase expression/formation protein HypD